MAHNLASAPARAGWRADATVVGERPAEALTTTAETLDAVGRQLTELTATTSALRRQLSQLHLSSSTANPRVPGHA